MSFDSIVGQDRAVAALRRALRSGRIPHAYIFAGPPGVGKMTTAQEFAKALLCTAGSDDACDACAACRKVEHGVHADIHHVEPEGAGRQIKFDMVREQVRDQLSLKPYEARYKIVLVDDAHAMNIEAANSLLKTLEEPPPKSVLILVTPRPDAMPETVVSRCQTVRFAPLEPEVIRRRLEDAGLGANEARFLARSSGGSLGRATTMAGEARLPEIRRELLAILTGLAESNVVESAAKFTKIVRELAAPQAESEPGTARAASRSMAEWLLDLAVLFYRDVAVRQLGVDEALLTNADLTGLIDGETPISCWGIRAILDTIEEVKNLVRSNVDVETAVLHAFSKIAAYRRQRAA